MCLICFVVPDVAGVYNDFWLGYSHTYMIYNGLCPLSCVTNARIYLVHIPRSSANSRHYLNLKDLCNHVCCLVVWSTFGIELCYANVMIA